MASRAEGIKFGGLDQKIECQFAADRQHHDRQKDAELFGFQARAEPGADLGANHTADQQEDGDGSDQADSLATDRAIEVLAHAGLEIMLCTPTATPPKWLVDQMPDMVAVDADGVRTPLTVSVTPTGFAVNVPAALLASSAYPLAIDPVILPEFGVDDPILVPQSGDQFKPAVGAATRKMENNSTTWASTGCFISV